ncbi:MAG: hypothetical protein PHN59_02515 [Candidatus Omnitrophica bacterium]|nr:hypothetical protein [Candidatus Omnitrophota bacterium]
MKNRNKFLLSILVILAATFILTPRFWEPAGESWKSWAAARILAQTGGFPIFSLGPLYVAYLALLRNLAFPYSLHYEYLLTHIFTYISIFLLLRRLLPRTLSLLLACAWIPVLATVEGGNAVAAIGFMALYLRGIIINPQKIEYFPVLLLAAALCHSAYIPFVIGNVLGVAGYRKFKHQELLRLPEAKYKKSFEGIAKFFLLGLVALVFIFPSRRADHNHMLVDAKFSPVPLHDPLSIGFFQIGNWKYVTRQVAPGERTGQDWYFTNDQAFGGATNILQAVMRKPQTVFKNVSENFLAVIQLPVFFIAGKIKTSWSILFCGLLAIGAIGFIKRFGKKISIPTFFALIFGVLSLIGALLLTWVTYRYAILLLPIVFLVLPFIGSETRQFFTCLKVLFLKKAVEKHSEKKFIILAGGLILLGIVFDPSVLSIVLRHGISYFSAMQIWFCDFILFFIGTTILFFALRFPGTISAAWMRFKKEYSKALRYPKADTLFIAFSSLLILGTVDYPYGRSVQLKSLLGGQVWLNQAQGCSIQSASNQLLQKMQPKIRVLALEDTWIKAFSNVDLDNIYNVFSLPPFEDASGETRQFLNSLDQIWVSNEWARPEASVGTQSYLRYLLHIRPFLKDLQDKGYTVQEIKGYGKIYYLHGNR